MRVEADFATPLSLASVSKGIVLWSASQDKIGRTQVMKADREIIELLDRTGHLHFPFGKQQRVPKPEGLAALEFPLSHPFAVDAIRSYQDFMVEILDPLALEHHSRPCQCDGECGPATRELMGRPRCGCPDYGPTVQPAVGTGSWQRCHNIGEFHAATVYIDESNMPSFLKPVFGEIWRQVVAAFEALGLRFIRTKNANNANIIFSFVIRAPGWIGLAIVGSREPCGSEIWCKYLATWKPRDIVREWVVLIMHELGHNAGLYHTRGGVMNPGIIYGLDASWKGDPAESVLNRYYGGKPIDPLPPPEPPPVPPDTGEHGILEWFRDNESVGRYDVIPRATVP